MMSSFGKIVLDYGDYLIRESEMDILRSHQWLNDVIIGFYIEYLTREVFPEETTKIKMFGPEMTQLLKLCSLEDLGNLVGDLTQFQFVFFPVNNFDDPEQSAAGGSHWYDPININFNAFGRIFSFLDAFHVSLSL